MATTTVDLRVPRWRITVAKTAVRIAIVLCHLDAPVTAFALARWACDFVNRGVRIAR